MYSNNTYIYKLKVYNVMETQRNITRLKQIKKKIYRTEIYIVINKFELEKKGKKKGKRENTKEHKVATILKAERR